MSRVFRLHEGHNNILGWDGNTNSCYGKSAIGQIKDPDAKDAKREITSIPSPFARIDLVKNAYEEVVSSGDLHGTTIFHKVVSDSLDIAQIFFNLPKLRNKVEVIVWDKEQDLGTLLRSDDSSICRVGQTLDMFLRQDAETYNFDKLKAIYLLRYFGQYRKTQWDIIGATSPATLFFSSANDFSYLSDDLQFGKDKMFDDQYASLDQRDDQFIRFYFAYRKAYPRFATLFKEVDDYMNMVYRDGFTREQKDMVDALTESSVEDFPTLQVRPNIVEINGIAYHQCLSHTIVRSGFEIETSLCRDEKLPLVLPVEAGTIYTNIRYVSDYWERTYHAPYADDAPLTERVLPHANETYPYLTISDLLTDTLIRVPKEKSDEEAFFSNFNTSNEYCFLLPLKEEFFRYFSIEQLKGKVHGVKMIEMREVFEGNVEVTLRIPIKDGKVVEYRRQYIEGAEAWPNGNKGRLIEKEFAIGMLSNIAFNDERDAFYRVCLMSEFDERDDIELNFMMGLSVVPADSIVTRNKDKVNFSYSKAYVLEHKCFDYIQVSVDGATGVLVPIWQKKSGSDIVTFAIDFGTTNTHIEYRVNDQVAVPFDMPESETMLKLWGKVSRVPEYIFSYDMLPNVISPNTLYHFPLRTALCEAGDTNWNKAVYALADANIPFPFEKKRGYTYDRVTTNLKWSNAPFAMKRVNTFIENLFMLLRLKAVSLNGTLKHTRIVWFYPISMVRNRYDDFSLAWTEAYKKYFGSDTTNIITMTESVAPYEHFKTSNANVNDIVTIDIGGGTSDIVIAHADKVDAITSFHFAADSIFGDSYTSGRNCLNYLLQPYVAKFKEILHDNALVDLEYILNEHSRSNISSDLASFLFSLRENYDVVKKNLSDTLDFNRMLQHDERNKIVFIIFYVAIIYHLAHLMKALQREMPRHIAFSGNGSRVIRILSANTETLTTFTKIIFEKIYEKSYPTDGLTILQNEDNPKEVTCKGGLSNPEVQSYDKLQASKVVLKGDGSGGIFKSETYGQLPPDVIWQTAKEAENFLDFVLQLNKAFSFKNNFGANEKAIEIAQREGKRDLTTFTTNGLKQRKKEVSDGDPIEETLFFYPINGMLHSLISAIYNDTNKNE